MRQNRGGSRSAYVLVLAFAAAAVLIAAVYVGGRWLEERNKQPEVRGDYTQRYEYEDLIERQGHTYRRRNQTVSILLMGIDRRPDAGAITGSRNGGQADFLRLLVIDGQQKRISQIQIDRDTIAEITILGVTGNEAGTRSAQIALSHGFGDGYEQSCGFTVKAVSQLLFDIPIDFYVALDMAGIAVLNDLMGGVTVTLEDDFSAYDPTMTPGTTLTLKGEQAEIYARRRFDIGEGTNASRMVRQEKYIMQLAGMLADRVSEDKEFIGTVYDRLEPYMTTNLSRGRLINEVWAAKDYHRDATIEPEGVHTIAEDGYVQFYPDLAALEPVLLEMFYQKVK